MSLNHIQEAQEKEYAFPYHHIARFKDEFSQCVSDSWGINYVSTIEFLLDRLKKEEFKSLVDIGCGDGRLTKEIAQRFPNRHIAGVDYSQQAISLAKAMYPEGEFHQINILNGNLDLSFDAATLIEVFEHIPLQMQKQFIEVVAKCLKPGGTLFLTVPHINTPLGYKHFQHFTVQSVSDCLKPWFKIIEVLPFEKRSFSKIIIDYILENRFFILNHKWSKNFLYNYYKSKLFFSDSEKKCGRIFAKAIVNK